MVPSMFLTLLSLLRLCPSPSSVSVDVSFKCLCTFANQRFTEYDEGML